MSDGGREVAATVAGLIRRFGSRRAGCHSSRLAIGLIMLRRHILAHGSKPVCNAMNGLARSVDMKRILIAEYMRRAKI